MGTTPKYIVIDPASGKIDRRIFSEHAVYDDEMAKIFGRAWLMIGHESLVPAADDFFNTYMGEDPVILTRDGQGRLHVLLNMCRHRGNRVCRVDDGNAKRFMCSYHGWTYCNDGTLEYVPGESEAYYGALDKASHGLIAARVTEIGFEARRILGPGCEDDPRIGLDARLDQTERWLIEPVVIGLRLPRDEFEGAVVAIGPAVIAAHEALGVAVIDAAHAVAAMAAHV